MEVKLRKSLHTPEAFDLRKDTNNTLNLGNTACVTSNVGHN